MNRQVAEVVIESLYFPVTHPLAERTQHQPAGSQGKSILTAFSMWEVAVFMGCLLPVMRV